MIPMLCHLCGGPALGACRSCGRPTCERHLAGIPPFCAGCTGRSQELRR